MAFEVKPVPSYDGARYPSSAPNRWAVVLRALALTVVFGALFAVVYVVGDPGSLAKPGWPKLKPPPDYDIVDGDVAAVEPAELSLPRGPSIVLGIPAPIHPADMKAHKKKKKKRKKRKKRR